MGRALVPGDSNKVRDMYFALLKIRKSWSSLCALCFRVFSRFNNKSYLILALDLVLNFNTEMYVRCAHLRTCFGPGLDSLR